MPIIPKPNDTNFEPTPQGNHVALCYRVIDLGTQLGEYKGKANKRHKILISWEIPDEKMADGRPFTIGQRFTWSMSEKATLRKTLESWRGRAFVESDFGVNGFDIKNIIGVGCMLNVVHDHDGDTLYSNVANVARLPKNVPAPPPINKPCYVWLSREEFSSVAFESLTDGLKAIIQKSPEYLALSQPERPIDGDPREEPPFDDEIPF